jgi:dihydrofolate reductase
MWKGIGTIVIGRNLFDLMNGWEGQPPAGDHVVVVSHRPKPEGWHPEASYHFVDDVTAAINKAKELARERDVAVNAGDAGGQIFAAGLVDEVAMDVAPVVFGRANATSAASTGSIYWRIPTWSSRATGCCT